MKSRQKKFVHTSKLTRRYQTTVPASVRKALVVNEGDTIEYIIESDKVIMVRYDEPVHTDNVVQSFLQFLELDMVQNPGHITPITKKWKSDLEHLVGNVNVDLNEPI